MRPALVSGGLALALLAGCDAPPTAATAGQPASTAQPEGTAQPAATNTASLEDRLSGTRLDLRGQDGETPSMTMILNADGTSQASMSGIMLTGRWQAEGDTLCQTDVRFMGMPSDDTSPQCVNVSVSGDRVTLVGADDDGGSETFTGTITPL